MVATMTDSILEALRIGVGFLWTAAWAIIMGLTVTSLVQVYVSKERMAQVLGESQRVGNDRSLPFIVRCETGAAAVKFLVVDLPAGVPVLEDSERAILGASVRS